MLHYKRVVRVIREEKEEKRKNKKIAKIMPSSFLFLTFVYVCVVLGMLLSTMDISCWLTSIDTLHIINTFFIYFFTILTHFSLCLSSTVHDNVDNHDSYDGSNEITSIEEDSF